MPPEQVRRLIDDWRRSGCPRQEGVAWNPSKWIAAFPAHSESLRALPARLDRSVIRRAAADAGLGPREAVAAFVAIMAWGYGVNGYGPFRTTRVLDNPNADERLATSARRLADQGPLAAYRSLAGDLNLPHLGVAFGTKFLYFCPQTATGLQALILDRLVSTWLLTHTALNIDPIPWNVSAYARYLESMHRWADELGIAPDELEECIFVAQASAQGGQWAHRDAEPLPFGGLEGPPRAFPDAAARRHAATTGEFSEWALLNEDLSLDTVPAPSAPWPDIMMFALTYDGYALWDEVGAFANRMRDEWGARRILPSELDSLRACLFFEQRRFRHFDQDPVGEDLDYIHALLSGIAGAIGGPA